jgi:hypothetical protein
MKNLIISPEYPQGILVDLTAEEISEREQAIIKAKQERIEFNNKIEQEKARKESAIAKLKALGLTEEEVKSIL